MADKKEPHITDRRSFIKKTLGTGAAAAAAYLTTSAGTIVHAAGKNVPSPAGQQRMVRTMFQLPGTGYQSGFPAPKG